MKCKKCESEIIVKNGLRRGKPCFLCKNCGHQFTNENTKYNDFDKYIAVLLYTKYTRFKKKNNFINKELRLSHITKLLNLNYTTVDYWVNYGRKSVKKVELSDLVKYIKKRENGSDILGLLFPDEVKIQPSEKLLEIIQRKNKLLERL